jgi:hypothetical protein
MVANFKPSHHHCDTILTSSNREEQERPFLEDVLRKQRAALLIASMIIAPG